MERTAAGAMAAAGFFPIIGWAGRAVKGGVAIYRTAKGVSTATHMLKAYNTAAAMKVLNRTEKGIYGLLVANSAYEFRSGKDLLGNKLTEEQRQNALWNGLILSVSGGAAAALNHAGKAKKVLTGVTYKIKSGDNKAEPYFSEGYDYFIFIDLGIKSNPGLYADGLRCQ